MRDKWREMRFEDAVDINPPRKISRGEVTPYVSMDIVQPFTLTIDIFEMKEFKGSGSRFQNGDTLLARITPCLENGKTAFVSRLPNSVIGHGSTEFIVLSGKDSISDNLFVYYLVRDPGFRSYAIQHMEGSTGRQRVPASAIAGLTIKVPPLPEQKAIASILGALDDKIELNRKMNETLEAMARAIFKSWFTYPFEGVKGIPLPLPSPNGRGCQELTGEGELELVDSPLGKIPKGWRVGTLNEIAELQRDSINPVNFPNEIFDHYSIPASDEGQMPIHDLGSAIKSNKFLLPDKCILISKLNPRIPRIWFPNINKKHRSVASTEFLVLVPKIPFSCEFIYSLCISPFFQETFVSLVTGTSSSHQRVKPEDLLSIKILCPPEPEIEAFSEKVEPLFKNINSNKEQSRTLASIRDTLLPKLLSGEIRVKDAERFVEARI